MFGLGLGLGIHRHSSANPYAFPFISRVESDGGAIRDKAALLNLTYYLQSMMPNTKLLYCPELGIKLRTSGVNNYVTTLYDISPNVLDGTQTTALNQPYLSGNIAPNEKYALKNPNGGATYITHTPISFSATDKWSATVLVNHFGDSDVGNTYCIGSVGFGVAVQIGSASRVRVRFISQSIELTTTKHIGKNTIITVVTTGSGGAALYINGILENSYSTVDTTMIFSEIGRGSAFANYSKGTISYICIRNTALTCQQVEDEYNYLRTLFPEIENVKIGDQTWATSNCEMACTPQGNFIQEMQASANVERITNVADREFSSDTGFWEKIETVTISNGVCNIASVSPVNSYIRANTSANLSTGKWYKITYSISRNGGGSLKFNANPDQYGLEAIPSEVGNYVIYRIASAPRILIGRNSATTDIDIDNISIQEVGWSDSTNLYNYIYDTTVGTAEQKEYAAVKAAAMWCYYNNDPTLGAVFGKLYNWYAVKLLQMDIDYYNAVNPTAPWGWRVPVKEDFDLLRDYLQIQLSGAKTKKEGNTYWFGSNISTNESGLSLIGNGVRTAIGVFAAMFGEGSLFSSDSYRLLCQSSSSELATNIISQKENGRAVRLIKS